MSLFVITFHGVAGDVSYQTQEKICRKTRYKTPGTTNAPSTNATVIDTDMDVPTFEKHLNTLADSSNPDNLLKAFQNTVIARVAKGSFKSKDSHNLKQKIAECDAHFMIVDRRDI